MALPATYKDTRAAGSTAVRSIHSSWTDVRRIVFGAEDDLMRSVNDAETLPDSR